MMADVEKLTTTVSTKGQVISRSAIRQRREWTAGTRLFVHETADRRDRARSCRTRKGFRRRSPSRQVGPLGGVGHVRPLVGQSGESGRLRRRQGSVAQVGDSAALANHFDSRVTTRDRPAGTVARAKRNRGRMNGSRQGNDFAPGVSPIATPGSTGTRETRTEGTT